MCVLALAWCAHPRWRLVVAGNRDEYHARPAAPLTRWDEDPRLIAGRDLQSGGAWLGVSEAGRFAVVTNVRGGGDLRADRPSRGALVTALLDGADPGRLATGDYNPVNLIAIDGDRARFLSNRPSPIDMALAPGLYGLSNGALDEPWPKTLRLKSILLDWLTGPAADPAALLAGLREEDLPDVGVDPTAPSDVALEPRHSPIFIRHPVYGTRCSTVVMVDRDGKGTIIERRYAADGAAAGDTEMAFDWLY